MATTFIVIVLLRQDLLFVFGKYLTFNDSLEACFPGCFLCFAYVAFQSPTTTDCWYACLRGVVCVRLSMCTCHD